MCTHLFIVFSGTVCGCDDVVVFFFPLLGRGGVGVAELVSVCVHAQVCSCL